MNKNYLQYLPKTLQSDFIDNRVIPFIGAGFSKNANISKGAEMLDWEQLGKKISSYIPNYTFSNAIDAFSLFEKEFSRAKLIEIIAKELHVFDVSPSNTHYALCDLYLETICTTNYDFLIEQALSEKHIPYSMVVSEDRLPINIHEKTKLIKLHGDFNHPERMVITENDYDTYVEKNKVLSTYVSNLFITKTLLLIGYSFDDSDIRTLWQLIVRRLGKLSIPAYVLLVDANSIEVARFERRNIKVINLPGKKENYPDILRQLFEEIKELISENKPKQMTLINEKATEEFILPENENRLCFISASYKRLSYLKELLYPVLQKKNIYPFSLDEVIIPGELITRKIDTLITKSQYVIIDISENNLNFMWELENVIRKKKKVIIIADKNASNNMLTYVRDKQILTYNYLGDNKSFIEKLASFFNDKREQIVEKEIEDDSLRLLKKGEYVAAVIIAFRILENKLSNQYRLISPNTLLQILNSIETKNIDDYQLISRIKEYIKIRNLIIHSKIDITKKEANQIVLDINNFCQAVDDGKIIVYKNNIY